MINYNEGITLKGRLPAEGVDTTRTRMGSTFYHVKGINSKSLKEDISSIDSIFGIVSSTYKEEIVEEDELRF